MAQCNAFEDCLRKKIQHLVEQGYSPQDITFSIGQDKKLVRALKLVASTESLVIESMPGANSEEVLKDEKGTPLPNFDAEAFHIFIELTVNNKWNLETVENLNLSPFLLMNLVWICDHVGFRNALKVVYQLADEKIPSFEEFVKTDDFFKLTQEDLKSILSQDYLDLNEVDIFNCACRWAKFQCKKLKKARTGENIRNILGDIVYEIRFPLMTCADFTKVLNMQNVLTVEEVLSIYEFISNGDKQSKKWDKKWQCFKTKPRTTHEISEE